MGSPARAALLVAMTLGLGGCFESQRDETYEGTVVLDDVDVRVLHAVSDAPALRLSAGGETRVEELDYGRVATFSLPANHHEFLAEGYTGQDGPEPLMDNLQGNLTEGKRHDLLLSGTLEEGSARAVLLTQDDERFEPFEDEEEPEVGDGLNSEEDDGEDADADEDDEPVKDVRFRVAHLAPGGGEVDLYLGDDHSGDPDATLGYGESTDALRVVADVYRLQVTPADNSSSVLYDSGGNLDWESEDDLLVAVVPATGVQQAGDSPLSLVVVDGAEARHRPDQGQQAELAFVNASESTVDVTEEGGKVGWTDVASLETRPIDEDDDYDAGGYAVTFENNDDAFDYGFTLKPGAAGTLVLRGLPADTEESASGTNESANASFLSNDARPVATNARVRLLNAASANESALDAYLIEDDCGSNNGSLPVDGVIPEPLVSGLDYPNRSLVLPITPGEYQVVATAQGDPSDEKLCESVSLSEKGLYELVIAEPGDGSEDPQLKMIGGVR